MRVDRQLLVMAAYGFVSGLPLPLSGFTFRLWLSDSGAGLAIVGLTAWIGLAYSLKFLWAPLLDQTPAAAGLARLRPPARLAAAGPACAGGGRDAAGLVRTRDRAGGGIRGGGLRRGAVRHPGYRHRRLADRGLCRTPPGRGARSVCLGLPYRVAGLDDGCDCRRGSDWLASGAAGDCGADLRRHPGDPGWRTRNRQPDRCRGAASAMR